MGRYDALPRNLFRGRSMAFVRTVLHKNEPLAKSAFSMAERYKDELVRDSHQFQVGMVVFWGLREPGDCGLYVGDGRVLCLEASGVPTVRPLSVVSSNVTGAMYWPNGAVKKVGARNGTV